MPTFDKEIKGTVRTISHCEDDPESGSWADATSHVSSEDEKKKIYAKMKVLQDYFSNNITIQSKQKFRKEGVLPNGKDFYAIKVGNIRAYGWFSKSTKDTFIISHYKYKDQGDLLANDSDRVCSNWKIYE